VNICNETEYQARFDPGGPIRDLTAIGSLRFNSRLNRLITLKFMEALDGILIPRWRPKHVCIYATKPNIRPDLPPWWDPLETLRRYDLLRFNIRLNRLITLKFLEALDGILISRWRPKFV
jgi:hypothetical protein